VDFSFSNESTPLRGVDSLEMNRVEFISVLYELCETKDEAQRIFDDSSILVDDNGFASRNAIVAELIHYFSPYQELDTMQKLSQIMNNLTDAEDEPLRVKIRVQLLNMHQRLMESLEDKDEPPVFISDRIDEDGMDKEDLYKIGKLAKKYHIQKYGKAPEKVAKRIGNKYVPVNKYTKSTARDTLDRAIKEVLDL
jgi:hypothetical protein